MTDVVEVTIADIAFGGNGVGRHEGKAVFVPFTIDGEHVRAEIVREKRKFAEAELRAVLEASSLRVEPPCPYFGPCGGCSYQHIAYEHQLATKAKQVEATLRRIAKLDPVPMRPIVPSPAEYGYRNRVTVHVEDRTVGYYQRESHRLLDIEYCPIAMPMVNEQLRELRASRPRDGHYTLRAHDGPRVFTQTNEAVADKLHELVAGLIPDRATMLIDAYCGTGSFVKDLRDRFDRCVGIEWDQFAIDYARRDATERETYLCGNVDAELPALLQNAREAVLIADPPATGLSEMIRSAIAQYPPAAFVYVSCNPATLARDIGSLRESFIITSVTPLDMFPQTAEIEVVVHLAAKTRS